MKRQQRLLKHNELVRSSVPSICKKEPCILGIDEAGRGPVLGPMTYAVAYYPKKSSQKLNAMKFDDSKKLSEATRERLFDSIGLNEFSHLGYVINILSPIMISNSMLSREKYNLNEMSHDTAINLIEEVINQQVVVEHVYLDTVGPADKYKAKLKSRFPKIQFTVANKADSIYPIVSAASVCAKVKRDRILKNWQFIESCRLGLDIFDRGSGYPSDEVTRNFLKDIMDPVFGFPTLARFSWSTVSNILDKHAAVCDWNEPEESIEPKAHPAQVKRQATMMDTFFKPMKKARNAGPSDGSVSVRPSSQSSVNVAKGVIKSEQKTTNADVFFQDRLLFRVSKWDKFKDSQLSKNKQ